jgi:hypothetical protein
MAGDLGTPDIEGEAKSSSLYVVSQLAIGNQRREPASKKVRHGITTISDLCFHVFFFEPGWSFSFVSLLDSSRHKRLHLQQLCTSD